MRLLLLPTRSLITYKHFNIYSNIFFLWRCDPTQVMASSFLRFLDHTQQRTTVVRTPLDELSARRIDFYPTTNNTHNRQLSMPPVGFQPTISAGDRPQTYALDRAATGTGYFFIIIIIIIIIIITLSMRQFEVPSNGVPQYG